MNFQNVIPSIEERQLIPKIILYLTILVIFVFIEVHCEFTFLTRGHISYVIVLINIIAMV
jgi:hypothetical protein